MPPSSFPLPTSNPLQPSRELPRPDLGALGYSKKVRETVDGAVKGAYVMGAADGFSAGQTVGYAEGRVGGAIEGSVLTAVAFGVVFFVSVVLVKAIRR